MGWIQFYTNQYSSSPKCISKESQNFHSFFIMSQLFFYQTLCYFSGMFFSKFVDPTLLKYDYKVYIPLFSLHTSIKAIRYHYEIRFSVYSFSYIFHNQQQYGDLRLLSENLRLENKDCKQINQTTL